MKFQGIYVTDDITGETRQISREEYLTGDRAPGTTTTLTGKDMRDFTPGPKLTKEQRIAQNKGLAEDFGFKTPKGKVAQGEKAQRRAANLDETIQSKINRGIPLTEEEKMYQRRAMSNVGINR